MIVCLTVLTTSLKQFDASLHDDRATDESMDTSNSSSEGEEIWELSDSESEDKFHDDSNETVGHLPLGITSFFHIVYRLSERAMVCLLSLFTSCLHN